MVRNRVYAIVVLLALTGLWPVSVYAKRASAVLAPCMSEQTIAVVRIDLKRVDVGAMFDMMADIVTPIVGAEQAKMIVGSFEEPRKEMNGFVEKLKATGCQEMYIVLSMDVFPGYIIAFPISDGMNVVELSSMVGSYMDIGGGGACIQKEGLVLAGDQQSIERCKGAKSVSRPILDKATAGAGEASIQVLLIPNADTRKVLEATLPIMFDQGIKVPANAITKGLQWAAISIDLPPRMSLNVKVESADDGSALALKELLASVGKYVCQIPDLREMSPKIDAVLEMLEPKVEGGKLLVSLDNGKCMHLATDLIGPGLLDLRELALRMTCGTNLSGLGKALLIYANDYNDEFPPDLETLIEKAEVPPKMLLCGGKPYIYRGVDLGGTSVEPMLIMVHDRAGHHKGGRNVLFVDSHVEWMTEEEFQKQIEEDNEMRRKAGLPEKPAE